VISGYRILVADDEEGIRSLLYDILSESYHVDSVNRGDIIFDAMSREHYDLLVLDLQLPGMTGMEVLGKIHAEKIPIAVLVITASNDVETAIMAMKLGAYDYVTKPFDNERFGIVVGNILERLDLKRELSALREEVGETFRFSQIIGSSPQMKKIFSTLERVIDTESTILITGESGTGKGVLAKTIHYNSVRSRAPFRAVDCSSLPENLIGSELFGHEKGSFTGAIARKIGKFEAAENGTLFLDEISNISIDIQAKLLRVIQEREFERIGGNQLVPMSARIVAASNRDIRQMVRSGLFREDLFYRLNVVPITIPPLRERMDDIPLFVDYFLKTFTAEYGRELSVDIEGMLFLTRYPWPGNIRQLENLVRRMVLLSSAKRIGVEEITSLLRLEGESRDVAGADAPAAAAPSVCTSFRNADGTMKTFDEIEKAVVEDAIAAADCNITAAAQMLGLSRKTLHNKISRYSIRIQKNISSD
jgi:DNA-binding NtrC family response regulator